MMDKRYFISYWYWGLLYTIKDDGGNVSIFDPKEADKVIKDLLDANQASFADKFEIPENWKGN